MLATQQKIKRKGLRKERVRGEEIGDGKGRKGSLLDFFANYYGLHHQNPPISNAPKMLQNALKFTYGHPVK